MLIRDSRRRNEQTMPDHDGRHAVYVPRPPGQQRWMGAVYRTVGSGNNVGHRIVLSPGNTTE